MPSWELFEMQSHEYKQSVFLPQVPVVSIEARLPPSARQPQGALLFSLFLLFFWVQMWPAGQPSLKLAA